MQLTISSKPIPDSELSVPAITGLDIKKKNELK